ncbi:MAG: urea ABC transporter substrate-binding protein [Pirellulaceae bacterium]
MSGLASRNTIVAGTILLLAVTGGVFFLAPYGSLEPIKVGILHSETGTMAISEKSVRDATLLAIEEINERGGLLGRKIAPVVVDGASDSRTFAAAAERLIVEEHVSVVFGCWTSASRKSVLPIFEEHQHLLFYPVQYEGLEQSPNIVYTGAAPNQQLVPAVKWCFDELNARRFFLVGSDYVFPRTASEIMTAQITALGGAVVGERYLLLTRSDHGAIEAIVKEIVDVRPDVILNTINGESNVAFFQQLRAAGVTPEDIHTMSFSIAEDELRSMDAQAMAGDYTTWNYFQSIQRKENEAFVANFRRKYGGHRVTDDPIEAGYFGVHLWAQAVQDAGTDNVAAVRKRLSNQSYPAPGGIVSIDPENQHTWKTVRVGRIRSDGQFDIVWTSENPVRPLPFPDSKSRLQWEESLAELFERWDKSWANPGP